MNITDFISKFPNYLNSNLLPWELTNNLKDIIENIIVNLQGDFNIYDGIAIHKSVIIEKKCNH